MKSFAVTFAAGVVGLIAWQIYINQEAVTRGVGLFLTWVLVIVTVGGAAFLIITLQREADRRARIVDGSYSLQKHKIKDAIVVVDPNKSSSGVYMLHRQYGYIEILSNIEPAAQLAYAGQVQTTRHLSAMYPGDDAQIRTRGDIPVAKGGVANTATAKFLEGTYRPKEQPLLTAPAPVVPQAHRLNVTDALAQSTGTRWVVGQADDGSVAAFEPARHSHAAIVGATGTGKTTSVGFSLALSALRAGWHVVILDPDGGTNWQPFASRAEWHETDRDSFPGHVAAVHRIYEMRATANRPQPIICIIEEYGDIIRQLRTTCRTDADTVDLMLDSILQRGRKRAMHLVFIDQFAKHWSDAVIGGTKFQAVFKLGPNQGSKLESYEANQLPDVGRFLVNRVAYNSFNAEHAVPDILRRLPAPGTKRVINGSVSKVSGVRSVPDGGQLQEVTDTRHPVWTPEPDTLPDTSTGEELTDIQKRVAEYMVANPAAGVRQMGRDLGISHSYAGELSLEYKARPPKVEMIDGREIVDLNTAAGVDEIRRLDWRSVKV